MAEIINIDDMRPHVVQEVICVQCCHRWIACAPTELLLKDYECGDCGFGYVIKTGQDLK
jgi:hypothetical protein